MVKSEYGRQSHSFAYTDMTRPGKTLKFEQTLTRFSLNSTVHLSPNFVKILFTSIEIGIFYVIAK